MVGIHHRISAANGTKTTFDQRLLGRSSLVDPPALLTRNTNEGEKCKKPNHPRQGFSFIIVRNAWQTRPNSGGQKQTFDQRLLRVSHLNFHTN
jgi:hypothetical protein